MGLIAITKAALRSRRQAYQRTFCNPIGDVVLVDLAQFCHANKSCFNADPRITAFREGQRSVWLRIAAHCHLTQEQQIMLYSAGLPTIASQGDTDA